MVFSSWYAIALLVEIDILSEIKVIELNLLPLDGMLLFNGTNFCWKLTLQTCFFFS